MFDSVYRQFSRKKIEVPMMEIEIVILCLVIEDLKRAILK